jgi:hypothetical protein
MTPPQGPTEVSGRSLGSETIGRPGGRGRVGYAHRRRASAPRVGGRSPPYNCALTAAVNLGKLFPSRSLVDRCLSNSAEGHGSSVTCPARFSRSRFIGVGKAFHVV